MGLSDVISIPLRLLLALLASRVTVRPAEARVWVVGVPAAGTYREVFNSDAAEFGGSGVTNDVDFKSEDVPWNGREQSIVLRVPPLAGIVLRCVRRAPKRVAKPKADAIAKKATKKQGKAKATKASTKPTKVERAPKAAKPRTK